MRITRLEIYVVRVDGRHPVIVRIHTDQGISGLGEVALAYGSGATAAAGMIKDLAEKLVVGRDPFRIEAIWADLYDHSFWAKGGGPIVFAGISAIETALWDIKGKAPGVPVYELLGGKCRDDVRLYANGWSFRAVTPDEVARAAEKPLRDGYDAIKFYPLASPIRDNPHGVFAHVSRREMDRDFEDLAVARAKAVRDAVGPKIDIMVDMSAERTTDAIIRLGRRLAEYDLFFFEEPVDPFDVDALKKVSEKLDLSIAVGERIYTRYGFKRILELRAADILQPDIGNTGGIMETKKIAAMAEAYNMRVAPHLCAGPVATAATLQLDACITNLLIQELDPYRVPAHFAVVDRPPELEIENGPLAIPTRPGLGLALVEANVKEHLWRTVG